MFIEDIPHMYAQALERLMLHAYIIVSKNLLMIVLLISSVLMEILPANLLLQFAVTDYAMAPKLKQVACRTVKCAVTRVVTRLTRHQAIAQQTVL